MNWKKAVFLLLSLAMPLACATQQSTDFGVQPNQLAHIPALTAILPCRLWPQNALFSKLTASGPVQADVPTICAAFDIYILESFADQPYMRGLSPNVVLQLLKKKNSEGMLAALDSHWGGDKNPCPSCRNGADFYTRAVASHPDWRQWLNNFSRTSADADSVLLPFITEAKAGVIDDRGLFYAGRSASLLLLLVDSNNGDLIWAGKNQAETRLPLPSKPDDPAKVALPPWEDVFKRLLQNEIWLDFPGRQN